MSGAGQEARLVQGLLRLYPAAWRQRYAEEFAAVLLADLAAGGRRRHRRRIALDVAAGALDAHLHRSPQAGGKPMPDRIRNAASTAFCASVVFAIAGSGFAKMSEDHAFTVAGRAHDAVGWSFHVVYVGAILAGLAVLAGGLPVLVAIVRQALAGRRDLARLLLVPPAALGAWVAAVLVLAGVRHAASQTDANVAAFVAVVSLGALAALLSTGALVAAARRAELPARVARSQWLSMTALSIAMVAVSVAGLVWGLSLRAQAPGLFHSDNGVIATALPASWAATVGLMAAASAVAVSATVRAIGLRRTERASEPA